MALVHADKDVDDDASDNCLATSESTNNFDAVRLFSLFFPLLTVVTYDQSF